MSKVREVKTEADGKELELVVKQPNGLQLKLAKRYSAGVFAQAVRDKCISRTQIDKYMLDSGDWTQEGTERVDEARKEIAELLAKLDEWNKKEAEQTKKLTKKQVEEVSKLCDDITMLRAELIVYHMVRAKYDSMTIEAQQENAEYDFLVSECVFDAEGNRVFTSVDDYIARSDEKYAEDAAAGLYSLIYGGDMDMDTLLPEKKFLVDHGLDTDVDE